MAWCFARRLGCVHLTHVELSEFRSWAALKLDLSPGITLICGANAAGKSNLVEAIYLLAALRSTRAQTEGELIRWGADAPQVMRVAGRAVAEDDRVEVEVSLAARSTGGGPSVEPSGIGRGRERTGAPLTSKRIRVNGVARRAADALGSIRAVQFTTLDIELLSGGSSLRRRYLDIAIAQIDRSHAANLSRYQRALSQRNALLKRIAERRASESELDQWDQLLEDAAAPIWAARAEAASALTELAAARHVSLRAPDDPAELLALRYAPADGASLRALRSRDVARGSTSMGPHRDDLQIDLDGRPAANFASRAQQRAAALSMRLAEVDYLAAQTSTSPILLLDDVFSELDVPRRERTALAVGAIEQVVLTSADRAAVPLDDAALAASYEIVGGGLRPA